MGRRGLPPLSSGGALVARPWLRFQFESEIRIKAISEGYDPTIGIMHEGSDGLVESSFSI
jgi:hypothetical protein